MERGAGRRSSLRTLRPLIIFAAAALITAALYAARAVFIPVALAVLLAFLLAPAVSFGQRRGLGRVLSVLLVVLLVFSAVGAATWVIATQITTLIDELPRYRANLRQKISDLRGAGKGTALEKMQSTAKEVMGELNKTDKAAERPVPVVLQPDPASFSWHLPTIVQALASAGLVAVLVVFMLIERHEMRNRLLRLMGYGRLALTTRALDDAAQRITRYLLMQSAINASFGLAVGLGLLAIGLPYALLWASLAGLLRFIPYVGTWMAVSLPVALSLAVFPSWTQPLLVIALFVILEPLIFFVLEPLLYGHSAGVSQVALLVAVAFWTWLWGPVGLILATPLTVCLVVLGKHVPALEFISVLMADEPALETDVSVYQRLLAGDEPEASEIVQTYLRRHPPDTVYDAVLVAALAHARRDREGRRLTDEDEQVVLRVTSGIREELRADRAVPRSTPSATILGCPARDELDELALTMLRDLVASTPCGMQVTPAGMLAAEIVTLVAEQSPGIVCIGFVPPGGLAQARYLCKRLRARFPGLRIVVGRWGPTPGIDEVRPLLLRDGADVVVTTLLETREQLALCVSLVCSPRAAAPAAEAESTSPPTLSKTA
jgi:predicted PurR-regulated permease PerM